MVPIHKNCEKLVGPKIDFFFFFWRSVWPEVWNLYPYLRIFLTQKKKHKNKNKTKQKQKYKTKQKQKQKQKTKQKKMPE